MAEKVLMSPKEGSALLGLRPRTVADLVKRGELPGVELNGRFYLHRQRFMAFLAGEQQGEKQAV